MTGPFSRTSQTRSPPTFRDRGVAAPFTTPLLAAARVRRSERTGLELVLPNLSGGKGRYVLDWAGLAALCAPTLHDTILFRHLSRMPEVNPRTVRDLSLSVALEGLAGRDAVAAARASLVADRAQRMRAHFLLLAGLLERIDGPTATRPTAPTPEFDRRVAVAVQRLGAQLGRAPSQIAAVVSGLGESFGPIGVAPDERAARIPRLIEGMEDIQSDLPAWGSLGEAISEGIGIAVKGGRAVVETTRSVLADPADLLKRRLSDPAGVAALAERASWLLDGWERVCLVWRAASTDSARRLALLEMAECLPTLPQEAFGWTDPTVVLPPPAPECRVVSGSSAWRNGSAAVLLTERNERFRTMSL